MQLPARDNRGRLRQDAILLPPGVLQGEESTSTPTTHGGGAASGDHNCQSIEKCSHMQPKYRNMYMNLFNLPFLLTGPCE